jgi:hypothetical protein
LKLGFECVQPSGDPGLGAVEQGAVVALDHRDRSERLTQRLGYTVARAFRQLRLPVGQLDLGDQPHVPLIGFVPLDVQDAADRGPGMESMRQALKRNSGPRTPCRSSSRDASPLAVSATPMTVFTASPELARDPFEEVGFGDRAVEVEDDGPVLSTAVFGIQVRHVIMFPEAKLL